jgi:hypothetical protein
LEALLASLKAGLDERFTRITDFWRKQQDTELQKLRDRYGPLFTDDVYRRLLTNSADERMLLDLIEYYLQIPLLRLADLPTKPPGYLFLSRRVPPSMGAADPDTSLWNHRFDLCRNSSGQPWFFFLDDESSVIVKLEDGRTLAAILAEIETEWRSPERPDPLGLERFGGLEELVKALHPDVALPDWRGVVVLGPTGDLSEDGMLRDLCGFEHIACHYAAVGGRALSGNMPLNVTARILQLAEAGSSGPDLEVATDDAGLALTRFDVTIHNTVIEQAEIAFRLRPQNLFGRVRGSNADREDDLPDIEIRGSLPPSTTGQARDLELAAQFVSPLPVKVDILVFDKLELKAVRVARREGRTLIELDGAITLQKPSSVDALSDLDVSGAKRIDLRDFRIVLPPFDGVKRTLGQFLALRFDFPGLRFDLPKPRTITLGFLDLKLTGIGFGRLESVLGDLRDRYEAFIGSFPNNLASEPGWAITLPHLFFQIDFGKLPVLGRGLGGLAMNLVVGLRVKGQPGVALDFENPFVAIGGLSARNVRFELFRFLSLEMKSLLLDPEAQILATAGGLDDDDTAPDPDMQQVAALIAQQVVFKIMEWNPLGENRAFDLMLLHGREGQSSDPSARGMLFALRPLVQGGGGSGDDDGGGFFKLHWLAIAQGLRFPNRFYTALMSGQEKGRSALDTLPIGKSPPTGDPPPPGPTTPPSGQTPTPVPAAPASDAETAPAPAPTAPEPAPSPSRRLRVAFDSSRSWMVGASFSLGEILPNCSFILHDQAYYAIRLQADWLKVVLNQSAIELAYMPGPTPREDRFRIAGLRIPALSFLAGMSSGEIALEWSVNWDWLIDIGYPWRTSGGYDWFRAFSVPFGIYEGKFGFFIEKRGAVEPDGNTSITLSAGFGLYVGYYYGYDGGWIGARAGIGIFGILQGSVTLGNFKIAAGGNLMPAVLRASILGVIGIFAYGEGWLEVWVISSRFRISAQASIACEIRYVRGLPCVLAWEANLACAYSASTTVGRGWLSFTFEVAGELPINTSGHTRLG